MPSFALLKLVETFITTFISVKERFVSIMSVEGVTPLPGETGYKINVNFRGAERKSVVKNSFEFTRPLIHKVPGQKPVKLQDQNLHLKLMIGDNVLYTLNFRIRMSVYGQENGGSKAVIVQNHHSPKSDFDLSPNFCHEETYEIALTFNHPEKNRFKVRIRCTGVDEFDNPVKQEFPYPALDIPYSLEDVTAIELIHGKAKDESKWNKECQISPFVEE